MYRGREDPPEGSVIRGAMRVTMVKLWTLTMGLSLGAVACGGGATPSPREAKAPVVETDTDAASEAVNEAAPGRTDASCAAEPLCALSGYCTASGSDCVASSDEDCRGSQQCTSDGACSAVGHHCVAEVDHDCEDAEVCTREGRCFAVDGVCMRAGATASR